MKILPQSLLFISIILFISSIVYSQNVENNYSSSLFNYSINFPKNWKVTEPNEYYPVVRSEYQDTSITSTDKASFRVTITKHNGENNDSIKQSFLRVINILGKELKEENFGIKSVNNNECYICDVSFIYNKSNGENRQRFMSYNFIHNNLLYSVIFMGNNASFLKFKAEIFECCESFKFLN